MGIWPFLNWKSIRNFNFINKYYFSLGIWLFPLEMDCKCRIDTCMPFKIFLTFFLLVTYASADTLPIAGISIPVQLGWRNYKELSSFPEQPFEQVWINNKSKSIRMVSTTFTDLKKVCMSEKWSLEKKNFVTIDFVIPDSKGKSYCAFKAVRGKENFFVSVQDNPRTLPNGKIFESQNILIEQNGDISSFKRWVASVKTIKGRNKK